MRGDGRAKEPLPGDVVNEHATRKESYLYSFKACKPGYNVGLKRQIVSQLILVPKRDSGRRVAGLVGRDFHVFDVGGLRVAY